jgi:hypothetical protein
MSRGTPRKQHTVTWDEYWESETQLKAAKKQVLCSKQQQRSRAFCFCQSQPP